MLYSIQITLIKAASKLSYNPDSSKEGNSLAHSRMASL